MTAKYFKDKNQKVAVKNTVSETDAANKALLDKNTSLALEHAKKALAEDPNDIDRINAVASLTKEGNPEEAKSYYAKALGLFKDVNNLDNANQIQTATTYWAAAGLAENAGNIDQAKQYYAKVIKVAKLSDSYDKDIARKSQAALERLK